MEYVILGLLLVKPMTIYELNQAFKTSISLFYRASYGSLQNAVKKLNANNLLDTEEGLENGRNKKIFTINEKGENAFFEWMMDDG